MVFKLCQSASKRWRRLDGSHHLAEIIQGVKFKDGEKLTGHASRPSRSPAASWILTFLPIPAESHQIRLLGILCFERNTIKIEIDR